MAASSHWAAPYPLITGEPPKSCHPLRHNICSPPCGGGACGLQLGPLAHEVMVGGRQPQHGGVVVWQGLARFHNGLVELVQ